MADLSGQVNTRPDSSTDSTLPSESHVIFRIQPMKVILLLPGLGAEIEMYIPSLPLPPFLPPYPTFP